MAPSFYALLSISLLSLFLPQPLSLHQPGFRISLTHIDAGKNFTKSELLQRAIIRGRNRVQRITSTHNIEAPVSLGNGEYLLNLSIGTPGKPFSAILDTGSDLIWTQCDPCTKCFDQPTPLFDPKQSSSFSNLSCSAKLCQALSDSNSKCSNDRCLYTYTYGDSTTSAGFMATETFTLGDEGKGGVVSVPNIGFGCGVQNDGKDLNQAAGIMGLGRGPLSLVSQLNTRKFSYCLTSVNEPNKKSTLLLGSVADLNNGTTTPLIQNPIQPSFYYLSLEGISVGDRLLPIDKSLFEVGQDGYGGFIIDSGTTITHLHEDAFDILKSEFARQMKFQISKTNGITGLDLCFDLPSNKGSEIDVPRLTFHFEGADLDLPSENYMIADMDLGVVCLAMGASGMLSIFGNYQQQNMLVVHDLDKEVLSLIPTQCDKY